MSRRSTRHFRGDLLRSARQAVPITNEALARRVDVTLRTVQRWQDGETEPRGSQLLALADVLGVTPDSFYDHDDDPRVVAA